jgi:catechol 2,3-dioxygenase
MTEAMTTIESLPATLQLGAVHLNVSSLDSSVAWYERSLGLRLRSRGDSVAELGDSVATSVVLHEVADVAAPSSQQASMFHYCLLYETREELARAALRIRATDTETTNMNDRQTHEAIYLNDPDGINIELAWDRARELWPPDPYGRTPVVLDVDGLLATVEGEEPSAYVRDGLVVGHVHFIIGDVEEAVVFYRDVLGMDLKYHVGNAAFFSVGGYHHQVATNIRKGEGVGPQPDTAIGMRHWIIQLSDSDEVAGARERIEAAGYVVTPLADGFSVRDPWNIELQITS